MPTIDRDRTILSRRGEQGDRAAPTRLARRRQARSSRVVSVIGSAGEDRLLLASRCCFVSPSMSFGFLMNAWIAGIITVEAKSGPGVAVQELRDVLGAGR